MLWNMIYETGIPIVDEQHKELFAQIDNLLDKSKANRVPQTLTFLGNYVVKHFSTEEGLQAKSKYPKMAAHQQMHKHFVTTYKDLKSQYDTSGENPMILMKISQTALSWLKEHIRVQDQDFAKHYKATMQTAAAKV